MVGQLQLHRCHQRALQPQQASSCGCKQHRHLPQNKLNKEGGGGGVQAPKWLETNAMPCSTSALLPLSSFMPSCTRSASRKLAKASAHRPSFVLSACSSGATSTAATEADVQRALPPQNAHRCIVGDGDGGVAHALAARGGGYVVEG